MPGVQYTKAFFICLALYTLFSCRIKEETPAIHKETTVKKTEQKPGSSYQDTLRINTPSVVFYEPDSIQLEKIHRVTDEMIFKGSMHEYHSQINNAHIFLKQYWPQMKTITAKKIRYLLFEKKDKTTELLDLDKVSDAYGMFVFDAMRSPRQVDMMNVESQVPDYFQHQ